LCYLPGVRHELIRRLSLFFGFALAVTACSDVPSPPPPPVPPTVGIDGDPPPRPTVQLSLQPVPTLFPPEPDPVKQIWLDAGNVVFGVAPGVKYAGRAFGGSIPAPTIRARAGDRLRIFLANRTGQAVAGLEAAPIPIALETDAVPLPASPPALPGQTATIELSPTKPGVFLYKAADPEAAAAGMFGMLIVDGPPISPPADREYAVILGELYLKPDPAGRKLDNVALHVFDDAAAREKRATHTLYNGRTDAVLDEPVDARLDERIRLYVASARPKEASVLLVRGEVHGTPQTRLTAGARMTFDFVTTGKGALTIVDDEAAYVGVTQGDLRGKFGRDLAAEAAARALPPPRTPEERRERGALLHKERCMVCHEPPEGIKRMAPDLSGVTKRHPREWLLRWLIDPLKMQAEDPVAIKLMQEWNNLSMPNVGLSEEQATWILELLAWRDTARKPARR
jgi:nitrite reductase (NO-forming)